MYQLKTSYHYHLPSSEVTLPNSLVPFLTAVSPVDTWLNVTVPRDLFFTFSSFPRRGWGGGGMGVRLFILFCRHVSVNGLYELREGINVILSKVQQSYEVLIIISIFMLMSLRHSGYLINLNKATEPENGKLGNLAPNPCSQ